MYFENESAEAAASWHGWSMGKEIKWSTFGGQDSRSERSRSHNVDIRWRRHHSVK